MDFSRLEKSIMDVIKEEQAKLGYRKEKIRLYYPLSSLNHFFQVEGDVTGMLEKLNRELGQTILLTEHRQEELFPLADRIGMMELGRLKQALPPKEMAAALLEEQAPLSKALPTPAKIAWALGSRADLPLTMKEGRGFLAALPSSGHKLEKANPPEPGEKILEAK